MYEVFISYSSKDSTTANAMCHILEGKGIRCFIAPRDIAPGSLWAESLVSAIKQSRIFVLVFSRNSNHSKQVHKEISVAVDAGLTVIPFIISEDKPQGVLEYYISDTHWIDALTPPLEGHIHRLAQRVSALLELRNDSGTEEKSGAIAADVPSTASFAPSSEALFAGGCKSSANSSAPASTSASAAYCPNCGYLHSLHHCPVCGASRMDVYREQRQKRKWMISSIFAWLVLLPYSILVAVVFPTLLADPYYEFSSFEYIALGMAIAAMLFFVVSSFELFYRRVTLRKRSKGDGDSAIMQSITARLGLKISMLYQCAFLVGLGFILLQAATLSYYVLTN